MSEELLELRCGFLSLVEQQVDFTTNIDWIEGPSDLELGKRTAQFVLCCCLKIFESFRRFAALDVY